MQRFRTLLIDAHEKEMYRMELEVNRLNAQQSDEQEKRLAQVRREFESHIEEKIQAEKAKNQNQIESAIGALREQLEKQKNDMLKQEHEKIQATVYKFLL